MELLRTVLFAGDPPVLQIAGELDLATAEGLRARLAEALSTNPKVVIDMAGVTFCDATGLRVLLDVAASQNGAGPLTVRNASRVKWLLDLVGLSELSTIVFGEGGDPRGG